MDTDFALSLAGKAVAALGSSVLAWAIEQADKGADGFSWDRRGREVCASVVFINLSLVTRFKFNSTAPPNGRTMHLTRLLHPNY